MRILPTRLLSRHSSHSSSSSSHNSSSGTNSPMRSKGESSSPRGEQGSGLALKVVILKARNLAAKDRGGTSDPYLVLTCGPSRIVTHTIQKTLNPEWNVIQELPINSIGNLLIDVTCWDKDRFGKDYLGEFELALEDVFANKNLEQEPTWYPLKSKRPGKKTGFVSGEVQLQFTLLDTSDKTHSQVLENFNTLVASVPMSGIESAPGKASRAATAPQSSQIPRSVPSTTAAPPSRVLTADEEELGGDDNDIELEDDSATDAEDGANVETVERRRRRLRIKRLKRSKRQNPYAFTNGDSDLVGIIFLEVCKITDLPPEKNLTRTGFDMDPFVVASLGKKTYRTKRVRHNLNPVFNEKMLFQIQAHEQAYSFAFTVIDHDKYSGNDFVAECNLPVRELIAEAPKANLETGLYDLEPVDHAQTPLPKQKSKWLGLSRTPSTQSLSKMIRPGLSKSVSSVSGTTTQASFLDPSANIGDPDIVAPSPDGISTPVNEPSQGPADDNRGFRDYTLPLTMKNLEKWESKHNPNIFLRAKYMPYAALRQQFWRALLRQYDTDESGRISRVEMTTMLDTLGSTLKDSTIDSFFTRFPHKATDNEDSDLTMDEAVICLEDQLEAKTRASMTDKLKGIVPDALKNLSISNKPGETSSSSVSGISTPQVSGDLSQTGTPALPREESDTLYKEDANEDTAEEHVVEIRECPICHQPRLNKRNDTDIITHIATCASQDWRQVNSVLMSGFVTASQAQRKWYSKVITKISYGGYKLGANSANILVQDRITGQINEEKMSVYVRLGIRMLYKGLKSRDMENKRIRKVLKNLSIKQGKKFDDPASKEEIQRFIEFHRLDMSEVLLDIDEFKNFNEFFYRALKPGARPCSAPHNPKIIVSPADCRSVVFNQISQATTIWVKGRDFSLKRLLGNAYPEDVARYDGGALGIFRLAPQDYHRFHIPVDGVMGEPKTIEGEYYTVNPMAIRSALDVYGENVRVLVPIDSQEHGRVMVICVGAMMVGSTVITASAGQDVKRTDELGYFKFGGSTILLLFEPGKMIFDSDLTDNSNSALETLVRVGMSIGHSPSEPQWTPDMRKDEVDITEADKKEAKRRIQGSVVMEESTESSGDDPSPRRKSVPTVGTLAAMGT